MLKKTITYTDFNDEVVTEDFYFHLSKADLIELEMSSKGGMKEYLEKIVASEDGASIVAEFKKLILLSYGKKSDDGRRFVKSDALRDEFQSTEAYSSLFLELCTNAGSAAEFVNGIVPNDLSQEVAKLTAQNEREPSDKAVTPGPRPATSTIEKDSGDPTALETSRNVFEQPPEQGKQEEPIVLTRQQLTEMGDAELRSGLASGKYKLQ